MLTLTENARDAVTSIIDGAPDRSAAGLRIECSSSSDQGYVLTLVPAPQAEDAVVEAGAARVFVQPTAAAELDDKVLDAEVTSEGVRFALAAQG
ncbi:MAG: Fe-S cluster assembly protein HesB [Microbacterium sp.]